MSVYQLRQHSNSVRFNSLTKAQQNQLRKLGYNNVGWANVLRSSELLDNFESATNELTLENLGTTVTLTPEDDIVLEAIDTPIQESLQAMQIPYSKIVKFARRHPHGQFKSRFSAIIDTLDAAIEQDKAELRRIFYVLHFKYPLTTIHAIAPFKRNN